MERINALINRLKEQSDQKADPAQLLVTVQLLQHALAQVTESGAKTLGTSKVSVLMPSMNVSAEVYEKYAPQPVSPTTPAKHIPEPEPDQLTEVKEVLVGEGTVSIVQENGQLDMVFDPMKEIPTLAHQLHEREVNDAGTLSESLNDRLRHGKTELVEVLKETPIKDLRKAIGINDRFLFINDLFRGDESMYERSIKTINGFNIYPEAEYWINRELKVKIGWNNDNVTVKHFDQLVKRRFS